MPVQVQYSAVLAGANGEKVGFFRDGNLKASAGRAAGRRDEKLTDTHLVATNQD